MASKKAAAEVAAAAFVPHSATVVLEYQGDAEGNPHLLGVPSRDLTQADICRLVYAKSVGAYDGEEGGPTLPDPSTPDQEACAALVALLLERRVDGHPVFVIPAEAPAPEPATSDAQAPETPAESEG